MNMPHVSNKGFAISMKNLIKKKNKQQWALESQTNEINSKRV